MTHYILAFVFVATLVFVYFLTKLFTRVISCLVSSLTELKAYALGKAEEKSGTAVPLSAKPVPFHPDFGIGEVLDEAEKAENEKSEEDFNA